MKKDQNKMRGAGAGPQAVPAPENQDNASAADGSEGSGAAPKKKPSGVRRFLSDLVTVLLVAAGVFFFLVMTYPFWSDWFTRLRAQHNITNYAQAVSSQDTEEIEKMWNAAVAWNAALHTEDGMIQLTDEQMQEYNDLLNVSGTEIMGSLEIPKINVSLPIYHGTSESVLMVGIGHIEGSSLPVGGEGTHCVLTGHTGMPSAELLTNLDQMEEGDQFYIYVLNRTLTYEVDQITVVLPTEVSSLASVPGEDYCTIVTCTPYGVNSHRLLVRGHRIETVEKEVEDIYPNARREMIITDIQLAIPFAIAAAVVAIIASLIIRRKKKKSGSKKTLRKKKDKL